MPAQAHNLNDAGASPAPATTEIKWDAADYLKKENSVTALVRLLCDLRVYREPIYNRDIQEFLHRYIGKILSNGR